MPDMGKVVPLDSDFSLVTGECGCDPCYICRLCRLVADSADD